MNDSWLTSIVALPADERAAALADLSEAECEALFHDWRAWARPEQVAPLGAWDVWAVIAGRGFGKTRTGAEWCREQIGAGKRRLALIAPTAADARDVMVEGESGILSIYPQRERPKYEPSKRRVTWPNGAIATLYSADEPERLRGPQHDGGWADEVGAWRYADAWDMFMFGLRLGENPQACVTTTPRPTKLLRDILATEGIVITRGSTYDNKANLAESFLKSIVRKYEGTRLGRQELMAEMLTDTPGALWTLALLEETRVKAAPKNLARIVVAIDPAASSNEDSDETGIVVCAIDSGDNDPNGYPHGYVLEDLSGQYTPNEWGRKAVGAMHRWKADRIIAEVNNGGEMVEHVVRTIEPNAPFVGVHASRGKVTRAEPVSALYEQARIHHVGTFPLLESQMTTYVPGMDDDSPDRMDATVWGFTDLMLGGAGIPSIRVLN